MKLSWLGLLNFIILQWFFIRLAKIKWINDSYDMKYRKDGKNYRLLKWIVPLTGWRSNFVYIGKNK